MVLPTLIGLGLALVVIVVAAAIQLRCADAAWEAARGLARGEPPDFAVQSVHRFGPPGSTVSVDAADGTVLVRVSAGLPLSSAFLPALHVEGHAQVACEPAAPCAVDGLSDVGR
ncbi:hypothetical protein KGA66_06970 [Actinocrinis puniceicyclus]|uniref:Pilus assembly protein TadE n=1 Tax=Actinocrinis puniceicyclus TaxID=977794 RepID=A0A8J7WK19_9ACTN|nr:TadE family type IV pilus minor pilin [Actinocrinis puniceicyclus]MBS2962778.1 hypothetical protein [Actinocrinis puniceicyclus]